MAQNSSTSTKRNGKCTDEHGKILIFGIETQKAAVTVSRITLFIPATTSDHLPAVVLFYTKTEYSHTASLFAPFSPYFGLYLSD